MSAGADEVVRHEWFGVLRWHRYGPSELIGAVDVDPRVRAPRLNGDRDVEVLIECAGVAAQGLTAHLDCCRVSAERVLDRLASIRVEIAHLAPAELVALYDSQGQPFLDRLFLDGLEFTPSSAVTAVFDIGELVQVLATVGADGHVLTVVTRD